MKQRSSSPAIWPRLKSTVAKRLAADLSAVCLNKDDLKETLGDTIGFANREENLKLSCATYMLLQKIDAKRPSRQTTSSSSRAISGRPNTKRSKPTPRNRESGLSRCS
ncbi:MAG: hypothetical protein M0C28_18430 [Candidatus Moduliflexus flocculans]|nr:hypothetical protein [Candidatus Moduliflexus flocculans]